ncbi:MAG TPA: type II toxin-antitoxin system RelE/ParE family toxin [Afifellaceae bacterium]|nr:type II toxin-antitoxin system RelE/ParE family toxin [Afifellaceae bacterium]
MIRSFRSKALERFAEAGETRRLPVQKPDRIAFILRFLDQARSPQDMNLPGLRFHALSGSRKGRFAVWLSENWRITFGLGGRGCPGRGR